MDTGVVVCSVRQAVQLSEHGLRHQDFSLAVMRERYMINKRGSTVFPSWSEISQSLDKKKKL